MSETTTLELAGSGNEVQRRVVAACDALLPVWLGLYVVSLATAMSGMEIFSSLLSLTLGVRLLVALPAGFRWEWPPFSIPLLLFSAVIVLGVMFGRADWPDKVHDLGRLRFFLVYGALFYYFRFWQPAPRAWLRPLVAVVLVVGVYGIVQHFIPLDLVRPAGKQIIMFSQPDLKIGPMVLGTFNHHLTFSNIYLFYACVFLGLALYGASKRWAYGALAGLVLLLCFWSYSRAAWLAIPISVGVLLLPQGKKRVGISVLLAVLLAVVLFVSSPAALERGLRPFLASEEGLTLTPRFRLWQIQFELFKSSPLIGVGWNNNERFCAESFHKLFPGAQFDFCGHAHSTLLQVLSTTGILGVAAFLMLWGAIFGRLWRGSVDFARGSFE